jgi:hypothetical protein
MRLSPTHIFFLVMVAAVLMTINATAQNDSTKNIIDTLLLKQKGVLGTLAQSLLADTTYPEKGLQRADAPFRKYNKKIIRKIKIQPLEFGIFIGDTTKRFNNVITDIANGLHYTTRAFVIRNHLFFHENELVSPYLFGDNERYLRDLPFLQDASIKVRRVKGSNDSVDVFVIVSDVLSIGGSIAIHNSGSGRLTLKEDNFSGWGDRLELRTLYDKGRNNKFGVGFEYVKRNILGSFIDASAGYLNFNPAFISKNREEKMVYAQILRPFLNPKMEWTYAASAEVHTTTNMFNTDSVYKSDFQYKYRIFDGWAGWNPGARRIRTEDDYQQTQLLLSGRIIDQKFFDKPLIYKDVYNYSFANSFAVLASASFYKLNYYKTKYIYGFGRPEDIPEGTEATFTGGWTIKNNRKRMYLGVALERYFLNKKERYFDYSFSVGSSFFQKSAEDINLLASVDFFGKLHDLNPKWKQRSFVSASVGTQFNSLLDEPLLMESIYGLPQFENNRLPGKLRITLKGESVFFSSWSLLFFKFAPFVFGSASLFQHPTDTETNTRIYPAVGGGIRTRNESLVFGTIELRGAWFPKKDVYNNGFMLQLSTNLRFKYNQDFIRRPEFVRVN